MVSQSVHDCQSSLHGVTLEETLGKLDDSLVSDNEQAISDPILAPPGESMTNLDPLSEQLKECLSQLLPNKTATFGGVAYRSCTMKYANELDLLNGEGSKRNGGRWNPIGISAVYASLSPETAMAESLAHFRYYGIPAFEAMPRIFVAITIKIRCLVDFRDKATGQLFGLSVKGMMKADWRKVLNIGRIPMSQSLGRAAFEVGLEGMILPSAADPAGHNLVLFPANFKTGSQVSVMKAERLPK